MYHLLFTGAHLTEPCWCYPPVFQAPVLPQGMVPAGKEEAGCVSGGEVVEGSLKWGAAGHCEKLPKRHEIWQSCCPPECPMIYWLQSSQDVL